MVTLTSPGDQTNADSDTVFLALSATDSSGDSLSYSATNLPGGLSINSATGIISGTISAGADVRSPYSVTVTATDSAVPGSYDSQSFTWTVNSSGTITVTLTQPADQTNTDGDSPTLDLSATDSASNTLVYGASNLPPGLAINSSTGAITGTITVGDSSNGPYTVTVTATDSTNASVGTSQTFLWNVNPQVKLVNPGDEANMTGDTVSLPVSAFNTVDDAMTYSASGLPGGLSIDTYSGIISGTITASNGSYSVTVTVTDTVTSVAASATFDWTVNSIIIAYPGLQHNLAGDTVNVAILATDQYSYSLTYSASNLPDGLSINSATGAITGTIASDAASDTPYTVTITATDGTYTATESFKWKVSDVILQNPGTQYSFDSASVDLMVNAIAAYGSTLTYTATGLPSGLSINSSTGAITGTLASNADASGPYNVTITATNTNEDSVSKSFVWIAANRQPFPQPVLVRFDAGFPTINIGNLRRNILQLRGTISRGVRVLSVTASILVDESAFGRGRSFQQASFPPQQAPLISGNAPFRGNIDLGNLRPGTEVTVTVVVRVRDANGTTAEISSLPVTIRR